MGGFVPCGKNIIHNANFQVWQRGTSLAAIPTGRFIADRWKYDFVSSTGVATVAQDATPPTAQSSYDIKVSCTTADTSIAAGEYATLSQGIEGFQFNPVRATPMALSFWVKSNKTGTYCVALCSSGADETFLAEYSISASATWEKKTIIIPPIPAGTWAVGTAAAAYLRFTLMSGSTYGDGAVGWQASDKKATSNQVNLYDANTNYWQLSQVQLEPGGVCGDFAGINIADDTAICERYCYQQTNISANRLRFSAGNSISTTVCHCSIPLPTEMRAVPSVGTETSAAANWALYNSRGMISCSAGPTILAGQATKNEIVLVFTVASGLTAGDSLLILTGNSTGLALNLSADI